MHPMTTTTRAERAGGSAVPARRSVEQVREDLERESARLRDAASRLSVLRREMAELLAASLDAFAADGRDELEVLVERQRAEAEAAPRRLVPRGRRFAGLVALVGSSCGPWRVLRYVGLLPVTGRDGLPRRPGSPLMLVECRARACSHRRLVQSTHLRHNPPACHACELRARGRS